MTSKISDLPIHEHFLTPREKVLKSTLDTRLQVFVDYRLLASGHTSNIDLARLILHVISENRDQEEIITNFFLKTLNRMNEDFYFEALQVLKNKGELLSFFHFADLKAWDSTQEAYEAYTEFVETKKTDKIVSVAMRSAHISYISSDEERAAIIQCNRFSSRFFTLVMHYLSKLSKEKRLSIDMYQKVLTQVESEKSLSDLEKINFIKMFVVVTSEKSVQGCFEATIQELIENMLLANQLFGEEFFVAFCTVNYLESISLDEIIRVLNLIKRIENTSDLLFLIEAFVKKVLKKEYVLARNDFIHGLEEKIPMILVKEIAFQKDIALLISRFATMPFSLESHELGKISIQYEIIQRYCEKNSSLKMSELVEQALIISDKKEIKEEDILELIAIARLSLWIKFDIYLHNTQILTVLGQLLYPKGCIAEVKTGEGKSMIVCVMAFIMAIQKKSVHVISSSSKLALRDQKKYENFFKTFGLISSAIVNSPSRESFHADILYGTASDFEFGVMREMLYNTPLYLQPDPVDCETRFDCVIVDEVDNLTIDTSLNSARLGYPAQKTNDWVYVPIFKFIKEGKGLDHVSDLKTFLLDEVEGRFKDLVVDLKDEDLLIWLSSAHHALFELHENVHYIIRNGKVAIVDAFNTGRIMTGSRWSKGIHEFVEVKHNLEVQQESITPISLSHCVYYTMYHSIYGLTGTLGSVFEREEMSKIYNVKSFDVPTYHPPIKEDRCPRVFQTNREYMDAIVDEVKYCMSANRPILVLCETIKESTTIQNALRSLAIPHEILNETQEKSEEDILDQAGFPCAVTVATNTAGRGTDILLKGDSLKNGGLHVLLTSFPASERVENQARGRTGRQGDPGSSALFVLVKDIKGDEKKILEILKQKRNATLQLIRDIHIHHAKIERFKFNLVKSFFKELTAFHNSLPTLTNKIARDQSKRRLLDQTQPSFAGLPKDDALIAAEIHSLLCSTKLPLEVESRWKSCLQSVVKRIQSRILNDWSVHFYVKTEELVEHSKIAKYSRLQELFKEISPTFAKMHDEAFSEEVEAVLSSIDKEFKSKFEHWNPYLLLDGSGILEYIETIRKGISIDKP